MTQAIKRGIGFYNFLGIMGTLMVLMGFCDLNKTLMVISFVRWELSVIIHNRLNIKRFKELRNCLDVLKFLRTSI